MKKEKHFIPKHATEEFHCPHCGVYAKQYWAHLNADHYISYTSIHSLTKFSETLDQGWTVSKCEHCKKKIIWLDGNIIYPRSIPVAMPNDDLEEDTKKDYLEAANIYNDSVRSSAALLRLALQKLCKQLGEKGENINDDIGAMVKKGLNPLVQKSLDSLRITGNNAVHPGEINLEEEPDKVLKLFELINFIAEKMITEPKEIIGFYDDLPEKSKKAVDERDE